MYTFPDAEVRWGIIGVGDVCEVKSAPAMQKIPGSRLVAVMRRDGAKAEDYARRHGVPRWYNDADALLADPLVNAIYIATPPWAHADLTRKAAAAGKPVYVEKPMARMSDECRAMIRACEQADVPLFVAYYRRYLPNYLKIKELLDAGAIGDPLAVDIRLLRPANPATDPDLARNWRVQPDLAGDGYFYDLASHQLDFLDFLLGPASDVRGFATNRAGLYPASDLVTATLRYPGDILATGTWNFAAPAHTNVDETVITGTRGTLRYPTYSDTWVEVHPAEGDPQRLQFARPAHVQEGLIRAIVSHLLHGTPVHSTGYTALRTNDIMEAITKPNS
jgi:predicted dehydrogenase